MSHLVLNHLWQSSVVAALAILLVPLLRQTAASARYWLWLASSVKFLIPFWLLTAAGTHLGAEITSSIPLPALAPPDWEIATRIVNPIGPAAPLPGSGTAIGFDIASILWVIWVLGFVAVTGVRTARWLHVRRIVRAASPMQLDTPVRAMSSPFQIEPGVFGLFRPTLLLPANIRTHLSPQQFDAILAHELCHIRRRDNLTAALHMIVEALFWFHPLVWWIGAQLIAERERACDEAVTASGNDRRAYAEAVLKICRLYFEPNLACVSGVAGGPLNKRIKDIMTNPVIRRLHPLSKLLLASATLIALAAPIAAGIGGTDAAAQTASATPDSDAAAARARRFAEQAKVFTEVKIDPKLIDRYVGHYQMSGTSVFTVTRDGDKLMGQLTGQPALEYHPFNDHEFFETDVHAQLTFITSGSAATEMVLHQSGYDIAMKRIDDAEAQKIADAVAEKIRNKTPFPGSDAALRRSIAETLSGEVKDNEMTPQLAQAVRSQLSLAQKALASAGPLQSITFNGVGPAGGDIYTVKFANATWEWRIALLPDGRVSALSGHPQP